MQPDQDQNNDWQQPKEAVPQAPYEAPVDETGTENITPEATAPIEDQANPVPQASTPNEDDTALLRWEGTEYLHQERSMLWYVAAGVVAVVLMIISLDWFHSITFAVLIPIMLAALVMYVHRPPVTLHYILSRKGLHIDDRLFPYSQFKSFGVISHGGQHSVSLVPRKRFEIGQTIYFPEEIGEQLVDMLAARLPMKDVQPDFIDRLLAKLHL